MFLRQALAQVRANQPQPPVVVNGRRLSLTSSSPAAIAAALMSEPLDQPSALWLSLQK